MCHYRHLQNENNELKIALQQHQSALDLLMVNYRQRISNLIAEGNCAKINDQITAIHNVSSMLIFCIFKNIYIPGRIKEQPYHVTCRWNGPSGEKVPESGRSGITGWPGESGAAEVGEFDAQALAKVVQDATFNVSLENVTISRLAAQNDSAALREFVDFMNGEKAAGEQDDGADTHPADSDSPKSSNDDQHTPTREVRRHRRFHTVQICNKVLFRAWIRQANKSLVATKVF